MRKATHRIEFKKCRRRANAIRWNWYVYRIENDELICFSNQDHVHRVDAEVAVENFLAAVKSERVKIVFDK